MVDAVLDPLDGRRTKDLLAATPERLDLVAEHVDAPLGLYECLRERLATTALTDQVDEVGKAALLCAEFGLLELERVGEVCPKLGDLLLDALEDVGDGLRIGDLLDDGIDDHLFSESSTNEHLVLASAFRRGEAAVVPAGFAADLGDRRTAAGADHAAGEEVGWEVILAAALLLGEASLAVSGPGAVHRPALLPYCLPKLLRDDPERLVLVDDPLGFRFLEPGAPPGFRIAAGLRLVPRPPAHVLLVVEDPADGRRRPALRRSDAAGHVLLVERLNDLRERLAVGVQREDAHHDGRLLRLDLHAIALRPGSALLVHPHLAHGNRAIAERLLADEEAALLLADLAAKSLLLEVAQLELVEDAADLDRQGRFLVVAVEAIGDGDHANALERELGDDRQHQVVVACQSREVVDENNIELA